jgi:hypothetical protein
MVRAASGGTWQRRVRPGLRVRPLSVEFPELAGGLPDGAAVVLGQVAGLGGESGGGEPAGARTSGADGAARIRGLFRSMPAILPAPVRAGSGARIQLIPGPRSRLITAVPMTQNGPFWIRQNTTQNYEQTQIFGDPVICQRSGVAVMLRCNS